MTDGQTHDAQDDRVDAPAPRPGPRTDLAPTAGTERILALDAARGLAILGIFCVNVQMMALPIATIFNPKVPADAGILDTGAWAFTKVFCEGKFYPLFSLLFGIGFALLIDRARARGARPIPLYLRRLAVLFAFGLAHIVLLWYGDILLVYSICALVLLLAHRASARTLAIIAGGFLALSVLTAALGILVMPAPATPAEADPSAAVSEAPPEQSQDQPPAPDTESPRFVIDPDASPSGQFFDSLTKDGAVMEDAEAWAELETMATRDGPFGEALAFRLVHYTMFMSFAMPFGFGPSILAMFFLGAAIARSGIIENRRFLLAALGAGMLLGLPASAGIVVAGATGGHQTAAMLAPVLYAIAPLVSLMYLAALALLAQSAAAALPRLLAPVGRMALTNYLMQSLIMAYLMQHWGLALFGTFSRAELLGLVLAIFICQIILSHLWLGAFRFGPMEWLWRSLTYLRLQPMPRTEPAEA